MHVRNVRRRGLEAALRRAGLGEWMVDDHGKRRWKNACRFHDLRHAAASRLVAEGFNVVYVSRQLGHASPDITLRVYAHLFDSAEHAQRARDALEASFGNLLETSDGNQPEKQAVAAGGRVVDMQAFRPDGK